jgi:hypothetical protein
VVADEETSDCVCEVPGVGGPPLVTIVVVRDVRAVSGVGALINDFFGVSKIDFVRELRLGVDAVDDLVVMLGILGFLPPVTKG